MLATLLRFPTVSYCDENATKYKREVISSAYRASRKVNRNSKSRRAQFPPIKITKRLIFAPGHGRGVNQNIKFTASFGFIASAAILSGKPATLRQIQPLIFSPDDTQLISKNLHNTTSRWDGPACTSSLLASSNEKLDKSLAQLRYVWGGVKQIKLFLILQLVRRL